MIDALAEKLGVDMTSTFLVVVEGVAEQRIEADDFLVRGDFVAFGTQLTSNSPQIELMVPKDKVLLIRREPAR